MIRLLLNTCPICLASYGRYYYHAQKKVISFVRVKRMMDKGCLVYLAHVGILLLILHILSQYCKAFPTNLLDISLDHDIEFGIDFESCTQPILFLTYRMALIEFKELNEQLQDILSK